MTQTEVQAQEQEVQANEAETNEASEAHRDYHGEVTSLLANAEERSQVKLAQSEDRIGRTVAVTMTVGSESVTAPRQTVIQALFENDWHRREITDLFDGFEPEVPYQIVFAATKNMQNEHHKAGSTASPAGGGRRGKTFRVQLVGEADETELNQADYVRALAEGRVQGHEKLDRGAIAKLLGVSYGTVYQATKDMEMPDARRGRPKAEGETAEASTEGEAAPKKTRGKKNGGGTRKAKAQVEDLPEAADPADDDENASEESDLMP